MQYCRRVGRAAFCETHHWIKAVSEGAREPELLAMMQAAGINSLLEDAVGKMLAGDTSYSEVMQVAASW
jgi:type II secretory ATPase GspE/PulE/Tfp pilus assembly ATPase PilB-like protein